MQVPAEVVSRQDKNMIMRIVECKPWKDPQKKDVVWKKDAEGQVMDVCMSAGCQETDPHKERCGMKRRGIEELQSVSCPAAGLGGLQSGCGSR